MKIECEACGAKYSVAGERVSGKSFRFRCKKCRSIVLVARTQATKVRGWYIAAGGEAEGPLDVAALEQRWDAGAIGPDTAVWREGLPDWRELDDVAELSDIAARRPRPVLAPAPDLEPATLTAQRNEGSILFSIDELQAVASQNGAAVAAGPSRGLTISAPASEGSGLIDIRALGKTLGSRQPRPTLEDPPIPSFGGARLGPLVPAPVAGQQPASARSRGLLYVAMGLMVAAIVGLAAHVALREVPTVVVERPVPEPPIASPAAAAVATAPDDEVDAGVDAAHDDEAETPAAPVAKARRAKPRSRKQPRQPRPVEARAAEPPKKVVTAECVLDQSKCDASPPAAPRTRSPDKSRPSTLPEKLSQSQLRNGIATVKPSARGCGRRHGAKPREQVRIKISVSGKTGRVTTATPQSAHAGTALGNCVAAALKTAEFPRFGRPRMGAVVSIRM